MLSVSLPRYIQSTELQILPHLIVSGSSWVQKTYLDRLRLQASISYDRQKPLPPRVVTWITFQLVAQMKPGTLLWKSAEEVGKCDALWGFSVNRDPNISWVDSSLTSKSCHRKNLLARHAMVDCFLFTFHSYRLRGTSPYRTHWRYRISIQAKTINSCMIHKEITFSNHDWLSRETTRVGVGVWTTTSKDLNKPIPITKSCIDSQRAWWLTSSSFENQSMILRYH